MEELKIFCIDFIKENPTVRDAMIKSNWLALEQVAPTSVKAELRELVSFNIPITDGVLFFHKLYLMKKLEHEISKPEKEYRKSLYEWRKLDTVLKRPLNWSAKVIDKLYTLVQREDVNEENALKVIIGTTNWSLLEELKLAELEKICNAAYNLAETTETELVVTFIINNALHNRMPNADIVNLLYKVCELDFVRELQPDSILNFTSIIHDVDIPEVKIDSMNKLEALHDARSERLSKEMLKEHSDKVYRYNPDFEAIVKECGLLLPKEPATLVIRGQQHSNCVGTYNNIQTSLGDLGCRRLIMTTDATCELDIHIRHEVCVGTTVQQYKGRYNKNLPVPESVTKLQIALAGKPRELFLCSEVYREVENGV
jgi:hypothetical protein